MKDIIIIDGKLSATHRFFFLRPKKLLIIYIFVFYFILFLVYFEKSIRCFQIALHQQWLVVRLIRGIGAPISTPPSSPAHVPPSVSRASLPPPPAGMLCPAAVVGSAHACAFCAAARGDKIR